MSTLDQVIDAHLGRNESVRPEELVALTHADRCDQCGARALVATLIPLERGTSQLNWCDHHYRQHREKLVEIAPAIRDERTHNG